MHQAFLVSTGAVALAEIGDKTQIANVPAILLGDRFAHKLPTKLVHGIAAVLFVVLGVLAIMGVGV